MELEGIASSSPDIDYVFNAEDFDALENIRQLVVTAACQAASGINVTLVCSILQEIIK